MLTILPALEVATQWRATTCVHRKALRGLIRITRSHSAAAMWSSEQKLNTPALFPSASRRPNESSAVAKHLSAVSRVEMSPEHDTARPPAARISPTVTSARSSVMSLTTTCAPSSANRRAMPWPMPLPAPVTMATRPLSRSFAINASFRLVDPLDAAGRVTRLLDPLVGVAHRLQPALGVVLEDRQRNAVEALRVHVVLLQRPRRRVEVVHRLRSPILHRLAGLLDVGDLQFDGGQTASPVRLDRTGVVGIDLRSEHDATVADGDPLAELWVLDEHEVDAEDVVEVLDRGVEIVDQEGDLPYTEICHFIAPLVARRALLVSSVAWSPSPSGDVGLRRPLTDIDEPGGDLASVLGVHHFVPALDEALDRQVRIDEPCGLGEVEPVDVARHGGDALAGDRTRLMRQERDHR